MITNNLVERFRTSLLEKFRSTPLETNTYTDLRQFAEFSPGNVAAGKVSVKAEGARVLALEDAVGSNRDFFESFFNKLLRAPAQKMILLAAAIPGAIVVEIPEGAEARLELSFEQRDSAAANCFSVIVLAAKGSRSKIFEKNNSTGVSFASTECVVSPRASTEFFSLSAGPLGSRTISRKRFFVGEAASAMGFSGVFSPSFAKTSTEMVLDGLAAEASDFQAVFPSGSQHFDASSIVRHAAPETRARLLSRACAKDGGRAVLWGDIVIDRGAKLSDSFLSQGALLLNSGARADAMPMLEIEESDVRATHSSSVSHLDENALFYLGSRGIAHPEAKKLLASCFLESALEKTSLHEASGKAFEQISSKW